MAKELPYFQFEPAEYFAKDISFCSMQAQGLFINICAYYWQRECELSKSKLLKRLNHESEFDELVAEDVIKLKGDKIIISFLDSQYEKATKKSSTNSSNGSKGGRPRKEKAKINPIKTETKPNEKPNESESKGIREEKKKEEEKKEDIPSLAEFLEYAKEKKSNVDIESVKLKYESWRVLGWKSGKGVQIKNWKSTLLNTLPHLKEAKPKAKSNGAPLF